MNQKPSLGEQWLQHAVYLYIYLAYTLYVCLCAKNFGIDECPWIKDGPPLSDTLDFSSQWSYWSCSSRMWLRLNHHTVLPVVLSFFNLIGIRIPFLGNFDVYISELLHIRFMDNVSMDNVLRFFVSFSSQHVFMYACVLFYLLKQTCKPKGRRRRN
jgi:hypothetical protein